MARDSERVLRIFRFIESLTVPSGKGKGKPFKLRPWQKAFIRDVYGPVTRDGHRLVRRAILSMARKNGKTMLTAAISLVHLIGPESEANGEIYSAANEREQAAIVFRYAAQLVRAEPELLALVTIVDSTKTMVAKSNGSVYRAVSAEAGTKYGLNPTMVIYDELAQAKNTDLYDALDTSMGAREEPLFVVISTQSNDPQHILSQLIDDGLRGHDATTVCHLYTVPEPKEGEADDHLTNEKLWKLANPALGDFRSLAEMRTAAKRAIRMPSREAAFRNLYLNQRVHAESPLIPRVEWLACRTPQDAPGLTIGSPVYLGLDLSGKTDLTALVAVSAGESDRVAAWFWKPQATLAEHERRDRVPYTVWREQGYIETTPGKAIEYEWVAARLARILKEYPVVGLAFDRYRIDDLLSALGRIGVDAYIDTSRPPEPTGDAAADARERQRYEQRGRARAGALRMVPWGQGYKDMSPAVEALEVSVLERKLQHDGHPVLTWNISNAIAISDPAGNRKLDKSATRFRIDGAVALAMALGLKSRDLKAAPGPSKYETEGLLVL